MALGKKCSSLKSKRGGALNAEEEELGLGSVRYTRAFGRKRIVISNNMEASPLHSTPGTPLKRQCSGRMFINSEKSPIESLPQDLLVRIVCGVEHEDLKQLFHVSKSIREAALIAKKWHFAYSTPSKICAFRTDIDFVDSSEFDEIETPKAPNRSRCYRSRLNEKSFSDISVALFASPKKQLFSESEM